MRVFFAKETNPAERRTSVLPESVKRLADLGLQVRVEAGIGAGIHRPDEAYEKAGAEVASDRAADLGSADIVVRLRPPGDDEVSALNKGTVHISYLDPFNRSDLLQALAGAGVTALAMELIPRTTLAQKMDALSSQASLGGYVAVILAAERLDQVFPMMMTPAGTLTPARVFVIGAGVAGLQAIATARRLGARVEAFDTRPAVAEQIHSLGAKFVKVDLGETGETGQGYARELTDEQLAKQREAMARHCAQADVVITTAQVFGRKAPRIVTADMVAGMKPGSVIVDMAVETGGNVEGSRVDEDVDVNGVRILGLGNLPGRVPVHASQMYAANVACLLEHGWDKDAKAFRAESDDEILAGCRVTQGGAVVHPMFATKEKQE